MTCLRPEGDETIDQLVDRLVADGKLTEADADAAHGFAAYLRDTAEHGDPRTWGPNLLRKHRALLGLTDGELVAVEQDVARGTRGWPGE